MKKYKSILIALFIFPLAIFAQEKNDTIVPSKPKLERAAFESTSLIDTQTNVLFAKGTLEMVMNHRFGLVNGNNDMIGIWAPANIRIGFNYAVTNSFTIGYGTSKDNRLQDLNYKVALLRQKRNDFYSINITYFGNIVMDARPTRLFNHDSDRWSFFNQLIFAKRFTSNLSLQVAPSLSHFNYVENPIENDLFAVAIGGRMKINPSTSILVDYNLPINKFKSANPKAGLGVGVEFSTGSHAFQLFITNFKGIIAQQNNVFNQNNFFNNEFLIGFNITRLWHM